MKCVEVQTLKHAYADGELDLVRSLDLEQHLNDCCGCFEALENVRALKSTVKSGDLYFKAPANLKRRIRASLRTEEASTSNAADAPTSFWWQWLKLALPITGIALLALLLVPALTGPSAGDRLAQDVTSSHVRSLMAAHLTDVASSDQHTVKPWFDGKLDFAPRVIDLADRGFPLVGGRLDDLQNRPVAALVYQRQNHFINLFIWPTPRNSNTAKKLEVRHGYNLIHWDESGMTYWAVSDLNPRELGDFVDLVRP